MYNFKESANDFIEKIRESEWTEYIIWIGAGLILLINFTVNEQVPKLPSHYEPVTNVKLDGGHYHKSHGRHHHSYTFTNISLTYKGKRYHNLAIMGSNHEGELDIYPGKYLQPSYAYHPSSEDTKGTLDNYILYNDKSKLPKNSYAIQTNWYLSSIQHQLKHRRIALVSNTYDSDLDNDNY